jgi:hypothetical protein
VAGTAVVHYEQTASGGVSAHLLRVDARLQQVILRVHPVAAAALRRRFLNVAVQVEIESRASQQLTIF